MKKLARLATLLLCVLSAGGAGAESVRLPRIGIEGQRFVLVNGAEKRAFIPWGFNYDRTAIEGRDLLLEDLLRERPERLHEDFAAMRRLGGNTVRVFLATADILAGPAEVSPQGLQRLDKVLAAARANELRLIVTGLANIRPAAAPRWIQEADDATMERAQATFWRTVARHCRSEPVILAFDLQNEPAIHWSDNRSWVDGCFDMPSGDRFCYVHRPYRQIRIRWTQHVQERFGNEAALRESWPDYPRPGESWDDIAIPKLDRSDPRYGMCIMFHGKLLADWARGLRDVIRTEDPDRLVTVGALKPPAMADAVDFYCFHLYPKPVGEGEDFLSVNKRRWHEQLASVPEDKPVIIEEFFPMWVPEGIAPQEVAEALLDATRPRATGWLSFNWGPPNEHQWSTPAQRALYEEWLTLWAAQGGQVKKREGEKVGK